MKDKLTIQNFVVGVLTALVIFLGGWVLDTNTEVALIKQRVDNEANARRNEYELLRQGLTKNETNTSKMAETMGNLDKTLSLLVDRLDRGDITVRTNHNNTPN